MDTKELLVEFSEFIETSYDDIERELSLISNSNKNFDNSDTPLNYKQTNMEPATVKDAIDTMIKTGDDSKFIDMVSDKFVVMVNKPIKEIFGDMSKIIHSFNNIILSHNDMGDKSTFVNFNNYVGAVRHNLELLLLSNGSNVSIEGFNVDNYVTRNSNTPSYESDTYLSVEADEVKREENEKNNIEAARNAIKAVGKKSLKIRNTINQGKINLNNFIDKMNLIRTAFYNKHMGKIDHMFENYGGSAVINENEVSMDPVQALFHKCGPYLAKLIDDVIQIYKDYNLFMDKCFNFKSYDEIIIEANKYIKFEDVKLENEAKPSDVKKALLKDLRFKVATALLTDNKVYGHTIKSIVEQKYPPIHHVMVSLFVPRPHEKPVDMAVSDVFSKAESFHLMSNKMKDVVKQASSIVSSRISGINIETDFKKVVERFDRFSKVSKANLKDPILGVSKTMNDGGKGELDNRRNDLKKRLEVLRDFGNIIETFIPIFTYVSDAGVVMYDIAVRIDHTCQDAVKALLNAESDKTDNSSSYKTGASKVKESEYKTSANPNPKKLDKRTDFEKKRDDLMAEGRRDNGDSVTEFKLSGINSVLRR